MRKSLKVEGMSCVNCARAIEITLRKTEGVKSVKVSFELGRVDVEYDEKIVSEEKIVNKIEELGYRVVKEKEKRDEIALLLSLLASTFMFLTMLFPLPLKPELQLLVSTLIQFTVGLKFYTGAISTLRQGIAGMDVLVSLGTTGAYLYSVLSLFKLIPGYPMFETNVFLITFVRIGKYIEERARNKAVEGLREVLTLSFKKVKVLGEKGEVEKNVREVLRGERVVYRTGEQILLDGVVIEGEALVNESIVTGESIPVKKGKGDEVISGSLVEKGYIVTRVEKSFESSYLSQIKRLIEESLHEKPEIQKLSDKVSHYFVQVVILLSIITFVAWYLLSGELQKAVLFSLSVLVVSCPCAFGIAVPLTTAVGIYKALKKSLLVKKPSVFELVPKLRAVVFDKTGTLTEGKLKVERVELDEKYYPIVYAMEEYSNHPVAVALREFLKNKVRSKAKLENCEEVVGVGVRCGRFIVGKGSLWNLNGENGAMTVGFGTEDRLIGYFVLKDKLRDEAKEVIKFLKDKGIRVILLTGDREENARSVADELGIEEVISDVKPEEKREVIRELRKEGLVVGMVGDGINDSPALATADLGIAVSSGTDVAKVTGDVIIHNLLSLKELFLLSERVYGKIKENLFWALVYNALFIPVSAGIFYKFGVHLKPEFAGLLMSLSSVSVVMNTLRLLRD